MTMLRPPLPQYEPKLTDHNETIVHHILLYACGNASALPQGISDCYGADPAFSLCSKVIAGWAVGGPVSPRMRETGGGGGVWDEACLAAQPPSIQQGYQFPDDVGLSIGTPLDPQWIRLEIHYSNFHNRPGEPV